MGYKHGHSAGGKRSRTYNAWASMVARCNNPNNKAYADYGGRGILVCPQWNAFSAFLADMGECPPGLTLDRIDNNGNYGPGNCQWATWLQQSWNRRGNIRLIFQGENLSLHEWAARLGVKMSALHNRYRRGWTVEEILTKPTTKQRRSGWRKAVGRASFEATGGGGDPA